MSQQQGSSVVNNRYFSWILTAAVSLALIIILIATIKSLSIVSSVDSQRIASFQSVVANIVDNSPTDQLLESSALLDLLNNFTDQQNRSANLYSDVILVLMGTLLMTLLLIGVQLFLWNLDRKKLDAWRESGFQCERLEFLPANRIKLNNIELELNKTQVENLQKLARQRRTGKPLHSVDMGDHAVQNIKRLREELGSKFIEKSLVKVRRREGYWLEVEADNIHGLPDLESKDAA